VDTEPGDWERTSMIRWHPSGDDTGASAVEYGLILVAIAAVVVAAVFALGGTVTQMFSDSCDLVQSSASTTATC
jgi:pilus assembly protein Flp/PilA